MNRKGGFVATSLIYSFFLAFLAIFAALLTNYISNKTILDRFNGDTLDDLNNRTFSLSIYATNANIDSGFAFTNLLAEATFETLLYWNNEGGNFSQITNYDGKQFAIKKETNSSTSSIDQEVYILDNTKYYYSVRCKNMATDETNVLKSYLKNDLHSFGTLSCKPADDSWQKNSDIFTSEEGDAGMYKFIVGENDTWNSESSAFFTEVVLINLTDSFGAGHEPTLEWLDKNVDFFSDTVSFISMDKIEANDSKKIRFALFKQGEIDMNSYVLDCGDGPVYGVAEIKEINDKSYAEIEFKNINRDMTCKIEWTIPK